MIMISPVSDEISLFDVYVCLDDSADLDSPLVWQSGPWSLCSKSCGGGLQFRTVQCVIRFSETKMYVREFRDESLWQVILIS